MVAFWRVPAYKGHVHRYGARSISVYLVDDHDIVRRGLRDLLASGRDITVVGESGSALDAIDRILALQPDLMLLDLRLQDGSGVEVCRRVRSSNDSIRALLLTSASEDDALLCALLAGADGYATKLVTSSHIIDDIRTIGAGRSLIDAGAVERVREQLAAGTGRFSDVSDVERVLLGHVFDGLTDAAISRATSASTDEVRNAVLALLHVLVPQETAG